jgi:hypothetical protein
MSNWLIFTTTFGALAAVLLGWIASFRANKDSPVSRKVDRDLQRQLEAVLLADHKFHLDRELDDDQMVALRNFLSHHALPSDLEGNARAAALKLLRVELEIRGIVFRSRDMDLKQSNGRHEPIGATASKFWDLLGLLFSRKMREQVYDPVIGELKEDLIVARAHRRSPAARRWIQACFVVRTTLVFLDCVRVALFRPLGRLVPVALKAWWRLLL